MITNRRTKASHYLYHNIIIAYYLYNVTSISEYNDNKPEDEGFAAFVHNIIRQPRLGLFHEFWLTSAERC